MNDIEKLKKNGWVLIKDFFDETYCDTLRELCYKSNEEGFGVKDLLSNPYLNRLFLNDKLLQLLTEILGEKPVYFGDSAYQIASVFGGISTGFHKDSIDRKNKNGLDWQENYSLLRVGIYLQDHKNFSEGLVVRNGSHKFMETTIGEKINVPSQKGDLVIWYLTTTHSGNAKRLMGTDKALLMPDKKNNRFLNALYKLLLRPSQKDRVALFMTFGKKDIHLERYLNYLKHRKYMVDSIKNQNFDENFVAELKSKNKLEVIDMKNDILKINENDFVEYNFEEFQKFGI